MIYHLTGGALAEASLPKEEGTYIAFMSLAQAQEENSNLPEPLKSLDIPTLMKRSNMATGEDCLYGALCAPREGRHGDTFFYLSQTFIAIIAVDAKELNPIRDHISRRGAGRLTPSRIAAEYFEDRMRGETEVLEKLEVKITHLEDAVLSNTLDGFQRKMSPIRRDLRRIHLYYERVADMIDRLIDEDELFPDQSDAYFKQLGNSIERLISDVQMLRDFALQVQQMYQAQIDIGQNNVMRVLTVVTTIFFPLSLITSWYGMNFAGMRELEWEYGYPAVIILSALVVLLCVLVFKRKKYL